MCLYGKGGWSMVVVGHGSGGPPHHGLYAMEQLTLDMTHSQKP
jgi:hypothetical protein